MASSVGLTVGDFSRATHLSVKTLHQVIRRLRDLEMPVADVKAVLTAPDAPARNALIGAHLNRLEAERVVRGDVSHLLAPYTGT